MLCRLTRGKWAIKYVMSTKKGGVGYWQSMLCRLKKEESGLQSTRYLKESMFLNDYNLELGRGNVSWGKYGELWATKY